MRRCRHVKQAALTVCRNFRQALDRLRQLSVGKDAHATRTLGDYGIAAGQERKTPWVFEAACQHVRLDPDFLGVEKPRRRGGSEQPETQEAGSNCQGERLCRMHIIDIGDAAGGARRFCIRAGNAFACLTILTRSVF